MRDLSLPGKSDQQSIKSYYSRHLMMRQKNDRHPILDAVIGNISYSILKRLTFLF